MKYLNKKKSSSKLTVITSSNSNQICLYYDNNSWSFTKLGHINLSKSELRELLAEEDTVTITIGLK